MTDNTNECAPWSGYFPKPSCRAGQDDAMNKIYTAISEGRPVLFEGACGTGKTLSALAPALSYARANNKTVVIATNMHQQMEQFIEEAREINKKTHTTTVVLKGKESMCPMSMGDSECEDLSGNTYSIVKSLRGKGIDTKALCNRLHGCGIKSSKEVMARFLGISENTILSFCPYLMRTVLSDDDHGFGEWLYQEVRHPDEVMTKAAQNGMCAHAIIKQNIGMASLVICNYHHVLNENIRGHLLKWMDKEDLSSFIVIFDEAHNVEGVARELATSKLPKLRVDGAIAEIENTDNEGFFAGDLTTKAELVNLLEAVRVCMFNIKKREESTGIYLPPNRNIRVRPPEGGDDLFLNELLKKCPEVRDRADKAISLGKAIDMHNLMMTEKITYCSIGVVGRFIKTYLDTRENPCYYPIMKLQTVEKNAFLTLELHCLVPTDVTKPIMDTAHSVVLMSATLQPFNMIKDTLGITKPADELVYDSSYPVERRITLAVNTTSLVAKNRDSPAVEAEVTNVIGEIVDGTPGNVMVLFPTMKEAEKYHKRVTQLGRPGVVPLLDSGFDTAQMKDKFFMLGTNGKKAVLFTYIWGKLAEGVDFKYDRLRTVVIVGVPYKSLDDLNKALQHSYDVLYKKGKQYGMTYPTIRRVRQAVGRVVRAPDDFGARILVDNRYTSKDKWSFLSVHNEFPDGEKKEITDAQPGKVKAALEGFFKDLK